MNLRRPGRADVAWRGFGSGQMSTWSLRTGDTRTWPRSTSRRGHLAGCRVTGIDGMIGWYVPPWMVEEYPDIPDWENLNKYSELFQTTESGDKGQLLDGDPRTSRTTRRW